MRKYGFTLIELLVYMAILGFIIVVAGRVFSDSTIMRVRSQNMLKSAEAIGKVSSLLKEDISQMGAKVWGEGSTSAYAVSVSNQVYWNATSGDYSSYTLNKEKPSTNFDSLSFRKAEFSAAGVFLGVREIAYWVRNDSLYRSCRTIGSGANTDCPTNNSQVMIATNIKKFVLTPSRPGAKDYTGSTNPDILFPLGTTAPNYTFAKRTSGTNVNENINVSGNGSTEIVVSGFSAKNNATQKYFNQIYLVENLQATWDNCIGMNFDKDDTYAVEFKMPHLTSMDDERDSSSTQLLPGQDHIAVGIRKKDGNVPNGAPDDILFYPPQSSHAAEFKRYAEFAIKEKIEDACLAITFAFYSPKASRGKLRFKEFSVYRKTDEAFHFPKSIANYGAENSTAAPAEKIRQKVNAKAFELAMEIEFNGEKASTYSEKNGNIKGMVITTPNNGIAVQPSITGGAP